MDVVLDLDVVLAKILQEDERVLHVYYLLVELFLLQHGLGLVLEFSHHDLLGVNVIIVSIGVVHGPSAVVFDIASDGVVSY